MLVILKSYARYLGTHGGINAFLFLRVPFGHRFTIFAVGVLLCTITTLFAVFRTPFGIRIRICGCFTTTGNVYSI